MIRSQQRKIKKKNHLETDEIIKLHRSQFIVVKINE